MSLNLSTFILQQHWIDEEMTARLLRTLSRGFLGYWSRPSWLLTSQTSSLLSLSPSSPHSLGTTFPSILPDVAFGRDGVVASSGRQSRYPQRVESGGQLFPRLARLTDWLSAWLAGCLLPRAVVRWQVIDRGNVCVCVCAACAAAEDPMYCRWAGLLSPLAHWG